MRKKVTELIDAEINHSTFVRASPKRVYDAIATAEGVDARPGGGIWFRWQDYGTSY